MRIAVTIAKTQEGKWVALALPDTPIADQKVSFKELKSDKKTGSKYLSIMILTSSGQVKRAKYSSLKEQEAQRKLAEKQQAQLAKEAKAKAEAEKAKEAKEAPKAEKKK